MSIENYLLVLLIEMVTTDSNFTSTTQPHSQSSLQVNRNYVRKVGGKFTDDDEQFVTECPSWMYSFVNDIESPWEENDSLRKLDNFVKKTKDAKLVSQTVIP